MECCLHLAGLRECCFLFKSLFQTSSLSSVYSGADTRGGGRWCHGDNEMAAQSESVF